MQSNETVYGGDTNYLRATFQFTYSDYLQTHSKYTAYQTIIDTQSNKQTLLRVILQLA